MTTLRMLAYGLVAVALMWGNDGHTALAFIAGLNACLATDAAVDLVAERLNKWAERKRRDGR